MSAARRRTRHGLCGLAATLALLAGCGPTQANQPATAPVAPPPGRVVLRDYVIDPAVDPSEAAAPAPRIVSAAPNVTEICCALGLRSALVGRTRYCDYPPGVEAVPSIGALIDVNVEALLKLNAELVLVSGTSRGITERLERLPLRFESLPDTSLDDLYRAIQRVGELVGRPNTAATLCTNLRADLDSVEREYSAKNQAAAARYLLLIGTLADPPRPPYVAGPGSFYADLLRRVGHQNIISGDSSAFAPLSLEFILKADPDVIVELDPDGAARPNGDADAAQAWSRVGTLSAVRTNRVRTLVGARHYVLGPRVALTFRDLCEALQGAR